MCKVRVRTPRLIDSLDSGRGVGDPSISSIEMVRKPVYVIHCRFVCYAHS